MKKISILLCCILLSGCEMSPEEYKPYQTYIENLGLGNIETHKYNHGFSNTEMMCKEHADVLTFSGQLQQTHILISGTLCRNYSIVLFPFNKLN